MSKAEQYQQELGPFVTKAGKQRTWPRTTGMALPFGCGHTANVRVDVPHNVVGKPRDESSAIWVLRAVNLARRISKAADCPECYAGSDLVRVRNEVEHLLQGQHLRPPAPMRGSVRMCAFAESLRHEALRERLWGIARAVPAQRLLLDDMIDQAMRARFPDMPAEHAPGMTFGRWVDQDWSNSPDLPTHTSFTRWLLLADGFSAFGDQLDPLMWVKARRISHDRRRTWEMLMLPIDPPASRVIAAHMVASLTFWETPQQALLAFDLLASRARDGEAANIAEQNEQTLADALEAIAVVRALSPDPRGSSRF